MILVALCYTANAQVTEKYDEFTGKSTLYGELKVDTQPAQDGVSIVAYQASGLTGMPNLMIMLRADSWVHMANHPIYAMSGSNRISAELVYADHTMPRNSAHTIQEVYFIKVRASEITSNDLRIRIGSTLIYDVPLSVINDYREITRRLGE